ncbi:MAG: LacI family DNA-binding transcriptional regulator, partial [Mucinivorans sp.]
MVKKQNISIASIAKQLQVAPSTVSRALNGSKSISEERTRQIKELAQKLNYVPNQMARNLKSGRRNTIAVVVPLISRSFFATVIEGIEDYASAKGYDVIIAQSKNLVETEQRLMSKLSGKVDGVIASLAGQDASHEYYNALNVPLVQFDRTSTDINAVSVRINDFMGAKTATQHLLDQGFRRIYHLCGLQYVSIWYDRQQGYLAAMHEHGLRIPG